jgi:Zn-dependent protease with chaperone function
MDFFRAQEVAKKNTFKLVALFALAVFSIIVLTNLLILVVFGVLKPETHALQQLDWSIILAVGAGVLVIVALGSLYKMVQLSGGGRKIAEQMNGELIVSNNGDAKKQRLLNVVEEMAIASGAPVPPVYMLPDGAINAFAAGHTVSDAVIGVSRGAVEGLTRDELQGVVGHEFSHILNGDMRLNIQLMGVLHGILVIGLIGYHMLRSTARSRRSKGRGGALMLAAGFVVIGYGGTFFGKLIKAAVSRQREYLADSAAVQFTRNPQGIAGALIRIGSMPSGSVMEAPGIAEISHTLFCEGVAPSLFQFQCLETHPPLEKRIKRILPSWDGEFKPLAADPFTAVSPTAVPSPEKQSENRAEFVALGDQVRAEIPVGSALLSGRKIARQVGHPTLDHIDHARELIDSLPEELKVSIGSPYGARATLYALLLNRNVPDRIKQLNYLRSELDAATYDAVLKQAGAIASLGDACRLPIVDLALPTLRQLSPRQYEEFKTQLQALIVADKKVSTFEWMLQKMTIHHLESAFSNSSRKKIPEPNIRQAREASGIVLSVFINAFKQEGVSREDVLDSVLEQIQWIESDFLKPDKFSLRELDRAITSLAGLRPRYKLELLEACAAVVVADEHVTVQEKELLRAVSSGLNCPMPILLT